MSVNQTKLAQQLALTGDSLLAKRAGNLTTFIEMKQSALLNSLKEEKLTLEMEKSGILDLSIKTRDALTFTSDAFNPETFVDRLQDINVQLRNLTIQIEIAEKQYADWFGSAE